MVHLISAPPPTHTRERAVRFTQRAHSNANVIWKHPHRLPRSSVSLAFPAHLPVTHKLNHLASGESKGLEIRAGSRFSFIRTPLGGLRADRAHDCLCGKRKHHFPVFASSCHFFLRTFLRQFTASHDPI